MKKVLFAAMLALGVVWPVQADSLPAVFKELQVTAKQLLSETQSLMKEVESRALNETAAFEKGELRRLDQELKSIEGYASKNLGQIDQALSQGKPFPVNAVANMQSQFKLRLNQIKERLSAMDNQARYEPNQTHIEVQQQEVPSAQAVSQVAPPPVGQPGVTQAAVQSTTGPVAVPTTLVSTIATTVATIIAVTSNLNEDQVASSHTTTPSHH